MVYCLHNIVDIPYQLGSQTKTTNMLFVFFCAAECRERVYLFS